MTRRYGIYVVAPLFLASCASIQGIPLGLTDQNQASLASQDLQRTLGVALELKRTYESARDENLKYIYWSSVPFFPLAAAAAGDIYSKSTSALAGVGIIAGTLAGFNSFTNARPNAKVYQSGINGLVCLYTKLGGYSDRQLDAKALKDDADSLTSRLIPSAQAALTASQNLDLNAGEAQAERTANPTIISSLSTMEKSLTQAISDAQHAATGARSEKTLFDNLAAFGATSIIQIDSIIASKVTLTDVSYSTLVSSISGYTTAPKPPTTTPPAGAAQLLVRPEKAAALATPIADAIKAMQGSITLLQQSTSALAEETSKFGLTAREQEVATCIKSL